MNHLATPAPRVSPPSADMAKDAEAATVEAAEISEAPIVEPARVVEPAKILESERSGSEKEVCPEGSLSVEALRRGYPPPDFEGEAAVIRGGAEKNCLQTTLPCIFEERDFIAYGEVKRFILVKDGHCFVFKEETDICPLYSMSLEELNPIVENKKRLDRYSVTISPTFENVSTDDVGTVLLKYGDGKLGYQVSFVMKGRYDRSICEKFVSIVKKNGGKSGKKSEVIQAQVISERNEKDQK